MNLFKDRNTGLCTVLTEKSHTTYILDPEGTADESSSQDYYNAGACPNQQTVDCISESSYKNKTVNAERSSCFHALK